MYIYQICESEYDEYSGDTNFYYSYLTHEGEFTDYEFQKICEEALEKIEEQSMYCLSKWLIDMRGFTELAIRGEFEFESKYD